MNKRDRLFSLLHHSQPQTYIPAAFFLHFDPTFHRGQIAVEKHIEYFKYTGMDFVKIQYEQKFPNLPAIQRPEDWRKMPLYKEDFFEAPLQIVESLVKRVGKDAPVIMTLYSPFMCAGHALGSDTVVRHLLDNPVAVKDGMEIITASLLAFVRGCIARGVDGFYHSTQGGEASRFPGFSPFLECIKPYDLILMNEINRACHFNILHICDYHAGYNDLRPFLDYPGHIVNCSLNLDDRQMTPSQISQMFSRPFMGGMDRNGVIVQGSPDGIRQAVVEVLAQASDHFILAADCTVPSDTPWDNLRLAIETAHKYVHTV